MAFISTALRTSLSSVIGLSTWKEAERLENIVSQLSCSCHPIPEATSLLTFQSMCFEFLYSCANFVQGRIFRKLLMFSSRMGHRWEKVRPQLCHEDECCVANMGRLIRCGLSLGDYVPSLKRRVGCSDLMSIVQERKPKFHVFGHVSCCCGKCQYCVRLTMK